MNLIKFFFCIILIFISFCGCKKNSVVTNSISQEKDVVINKVVKDTIVDRNILRKTDSIGKNKISNDSLFIINENINILKLPIGSQVIERHNFPFKFGMGGTSDSNKDIHSKKYETAFLNNSSIAILKGVKKTNLNYFKKHSDRRKEVFNKDSLLNNMQVIGEVDHKKYSVYFINTNTDPYLSFSKFRSTILKVVDNERRVIDELEIFLNISDNLISSLKLFYINEDFVITNKSFSSLEGEVTFLNSEKYQLTADGKFVPYYDKNGTFESDNEQGFVKNNTRDGNWIEKKELQNDYYFIESNYKNGLAVGTWKYYNLVYDIDLSYSTTDKPIYKTATKGKLLYFETYKNGKMVKRDLIKND